MMTDLTTSPESANTVQLVCLPCEDPPNPPIYWGTNFLLYPLFKGVATGGGILSEPYCGVSGLGLCVYVKHNASILQAEYPKYWASLVQE